MANTPAHFPVYTMQSAPEESKPVLVGLNETFGFVPNVAGAMAESPHLLGSFIGLFERVHAGTFNEAQIQIVLLTNAVTNRCAWAAAFHTALALKQGVNGADVNAIRAGRRPAGASDAALSGLAKALIEGRGTTGDGELARFLDSGFSRAQSLELIAIVAASTITNYVSNLTRISLEQAFQMHAWP